MGPVRCTPVDLLQNFSDLINNALDQGMYVAVMFVDLSKAFDSINHVKMLLALQNVGIRGQVLELFKSYLERRTCKVKIVGVDSEQSEIEEGVPQGSFLGPLLYLLYINDVSSCFKFCKYFIYADDTVIISIHKDMNVAEERLKKEFLRYQSWCHDKNLNMNGEKTKVMLITTPHAERRNLNIPFHDIGCVHGKASDCHCDKKIENIESMKYLGVMIDKNFDWKCQVKYLVGKLKCCLFKLSMMEDVVPYRILKMTYMSLFQSVLVYGIEIWGRASITNLEPLIDIQRRALKTLSKKLHKNNVINNHYISNGVMPLENLIKYKILIRNYFCDEFRKQNEHKYETRTKTYCYDLSFNKYGERCSKILVPKLLNSLSSDLIKIQKISTLKTKLKDYFLNVL